MMATGAWQLLRPEIRAGRRLRTAILFLAALGASLGFSISPVAVLGLAALVGLLWRARE
jgi:hypothetical protein